jgi:O-antigen ligase
MAIISIAKFLLLLCGLAILLFDSQARSTYKSVRNAYTPVALLVVLLSFAASLLWTLAPQADALGSMAKYGKLLLVVLMLYLIRNRREASYALCAFVGAQIFLLTSSWLLFFQIPVPWATSKMALTDYAVFSSYLDQGIISAVLAAMCWHLRSLMPGRFGKHAAVFIALIALSNVLFVLSGRTGHVVAIALLSLAIMWELPKKYRAAVVALPFLLALLLFASSSKVRDRLTLVKTEVQAYSIQTTSTTSSGIRLGFWHSAVDIIAQHPFAGAGVGSWSTEHNRLQHAKNPAHVDIQGNGNPHQEYLLWGVQLGIPGILLFVGLMVSIWRDALQMDELYARATQSVLAALAVACLFNSSIYDALIGDFFCIVIGLLLALGFRQPKSVDLMPTPRCAT